VQRKFWGLRITNRHCTFAREEGATPSPRERGEGRGEGQARGLRRCGARTTSALSVHDCCGARSREQSSPTGPRSARPEDRLLWTRLRGRQLGGFKFVRQQPIARYYVDFVCRERRLIIELDGGQHAENAQDRERDRTLCALGYRVIRIWNNDVIHISKEFSKRCWPNSNDCPSPRPSPRKRGEGDNSLRIEAFESMRNAPDVGQQFALEP
jgi:very-short-patch-repair endonuclease